MASTPYTADERLALPLYGLRFVLTQCLVAVARIIRLLLYDLKPLLRNSLPVFELLLRGG